MSKGILGKKVGMTQIFNDEGDAIPVTVIKAGPCSVVQKKTEEVDGYNAIQLGFGEVDEHKLNKPLQGHFEKYGVAPKKYIKEFKNGQQEDYEVGDEVLADIFTEGELVNVTGTSKGKGFAGTIKRWNFTTGPKSHGSRNVRKPGAISAGTDPARVFKGKKMPGRMGGEQVTIENLEVIKVDPEQNILAVKGAVPGPKKGLLVIKGAKEF
ncbi:50S ribosomal protein L3 [Fuchsiella alkaliacetigena]|uniref:50S ribosomal protein L3 n=1 Tax=Fuchsiella alkaliacetigena TaxID=957042 RepID=UPI00200AEFD2|nr:50S ribosomal protein L3 [Fuchsiella alkaliacetigena]MCK8824347.1 50S ribosomal protein L3 [Fuchsiella alkaliacetigena]